MECLPSLASWARQEVVSKAQETSRFQQVSVCVKSPVKTREPQETPSSCLKQTSHFFLVDPAARAALLTLVCQLPAGSSSVPGRTPHLQKHQGYLWHAVGHFWGARGHQVLGLYETGGLAMHHHSKFMWALYVHCCLPKEGPGLNLSW